MPYHRHRRDNGTGNVSSERVSSSSSITSGEKQDGQLSTSVASAAPGKTETGEQQPAAAEAPAAAAATAETPACCSKCQGPLAAVEEPTPAIATTTEAETQTTAVAEAVAPPSQQQQQPQGEEMEKEKEFDLDLFKLKRQAAKLRDELAKKRFAEMALDVRLKETEVRTRVFGFVFGFVMCVRVGFGFFLGGWYVQPAQMSSIHARTGARPPHFQSNHPTPPRPTRRRRRPASRRSFGGGRPWWSR